MYPISLKKRLNPLDPLIGDDPRVGVPVGYPVRSVQDVDPVGAPQSNYAPSAYQEPPVRLPNVTDNLNPQNNAAAFYPVASRPRTVSPVGDEQATYPQLHSTMTATPQTGYPQLKSTVTAVPQAAPIGNGLTDDALEPSNSMVGAPVAPVDPLTDAYNRRNNLLKNGAPKDHSLVNRIFTGALRGLGRGGLGGGIAEGLIEGFYPKVNTNINTQGQLAKSDAEVAALQSQRGNDQKYRLGEAQIKTIGTDDDTNKLRVQEQIDARTAKDKETKRANFYKQHKFFDPTKASISERKQLAEFGETPDTIGKFDFTDPKTKKVGADEFQWSPNENAWVDSGLPKNQAGAFTEITAQDPTDGKTYTYVTTQEKAAALLNGKVIGNMQIIAAKDRQVSQQQFTAQQTQIHAQLAKELADYKAAIADAAAEKDETRKQAAEQRAQVSKEALIRLRAQLDH